MTSMASSLASDHVLGKRKRSQSVQSCDTDDTDSATLLSERGADDEHDSNSGTDSEPEALEGDGIDYDTLFVAEDEEFDEANMPSEYTVDPDANYHEGKEPYPKLPAYDPAFSDIEAGLTGIVEQIIDIVDRHPCKSSYVKNFRAKAEELRAVPRPRPMRIALLGDTGTGMFV